MFLLLIFINLFAITFTDKPCQKSDIDNLIKNLNKNNLHDSLATLIEKCNFHPRKVYKLCKKFEKDCVYYKAQTYEFYGNTKDAQDLYLRSLNYEKYIFIKAMKANDPRDLIKKYNINKVASLYLLCVYYNSIGDWKNIIKLKKQIIYSDDKYKAKLVFYLTYALIMNGNIDEVSKYLNFKFKYFYDNLEIKKANAVYLYAYNKQYEARIVFEEILKYYNFDFISLKYLSEIYFRTGFLSKAINTINKLIDKESIDTQRFYLLKEKAFMLARYSKISDSINVVNKINNEFKNNDSLIYEYIVLLINYSYINEAKIFINKLKKINLYYYYLAMSTLEDYALNLQKSLEYLILARKINETDELKQRINLLKKIIVNEETNNKSFGCENVKIKDIKGEYSQVNLNGANYFIKQINNNYIINLFINFSYKEGINKDYINLKSFVNKIEKFWSKYGLKLNILEGGTNFVKFDFFPSSLYLKRASSVSWPILLNDRVYFHEIGHQLGLNDEYYEADVRLSKFNINRIIGDKNSIMRNILSGNPLKKHIELILNPFIFCGAKNVK